MTFPVGVEVGNVAGFAARLQEQGLSARAGLAAYRAAGGAIRDARWFHAWGEVGAAHERAPEVGAHPLNVPPDTSIITDWHAGTAGQFATQVKVLVREAGSDFYSVREYTHITEGPHVGQEAVDAAMDVYSTSEDEYDEDVAGAFVSGYYQMLGPAQ